MEFRKQMNGIALAMVAGVWASVAVGQGQSPSIGDLLVSDPQPQAPAAKPVEKPAAKAPAAKPAAKAPTAKPAEKPAAKPVAKPAEKPVAKAPAAKPTEKPAAKAPTAKPAEKPAAAPAEDEADEISLNDADDSAVAAKGRPVVKLAPQASAAPASPAAPAADAAAKAPSAPATGSEIAARFLASDETALVDISSDDATLTDILRQFRRATGANIIYAESSNLHQRVSVSLKHVPWLQGMKSILASRGYRVESTGGIHFVKEDKQAEPIFTRTFQLNHASVDELAKLFNDSYGVKDKSGKLIKGVATPFQGANTIVVTSTDRVLADCEAIIKAVDKAVPQIYIEARFIELSNEAMHRLGIKWDQLGVERGWGASIKDVSAGMSYGNTKDKLLSLANSTSGSGTATGSSSAGITTTGDATTRTSSYSESIEQTFSSGSNGKTDSSTDKDYSRMFSGQLSVEDFRLALNAFEEMEDAKIFSNPKIIVSNGKEALFDKTTKFPNVTVNSQHDTQSGYTSNQTKLEVIPGEDDLFSKKKTAFFSWGITLTVKPRISPDGLISVEIVPAISEKTDEYSINSGSDSPYGRYPIILFKRLTTEFTMKDGATAVIGGLSTTDERDVDSGIPYLRKIPWIGQKLFGWKSREKVQHEILIFVTVGIADPANLPEDVGLPKNAVRGREYVEKRVFEPGDRPNAAADITKLDMHTLDERHAIEEKKAAEQRGTVTITPVVNE